MPRPGAILLACALATLGVGSARAQRSGGEAGGIRSSAVFHSGVSGAFTASPRLAPFAFGQSSRPAPGGFHGPYGGAFSPGYRFSGTTRSPFDGAHGDPSKPSGGFGGDRHPYHGVHRHRDHGPFWSGYGGSPGYGLGSNYVGYPYPYGYGWTLDLNDGSDGDGDSDSQQAQDSGGESQADPSGSAPQSVSNAPDEEAPPPSPYGDRFRPSYSPDYAAPTAPVKRQPETILVFNDGRAQERVRNYVLTPTTLYALDGDRRRAIPIAAIDLPATVKANRAAGVDFNLPSLTGQ